MRPSRNPVSVLESGYDRLLLFLPSPTLTVKVLNCEMLFYFEVSQKQNLMQGYEYVVCWEVTGCCGSGEGKAANRPDPPSQHPGGKALGGSANALPER